MASGDSLLTADALSNRPPQSDYATVDVRGDFVVLDFDDSTNEQAQFQSVVPSHYGGGDLIVALAWTSTTAIAGNCRFGCELVQLASGANLDSPPAASGSGEVLAAAPATTGDLVFSEVGPISITSLFPGELLQVLITRQASDASDTLSGDAELVSLEIREA